MASDLWLEANNQRWHRSDSSHTGNHPRLTQDQQISRPIIRLKAWTLLAKEPSKWNISPLPAHTDLLPDLKERSGVYQPIVMWNGGFNSCVAQHVLILWFREKYLDIINSYTQNKSGTKTRGWIYSTVSLVTVHNPRTFPTEEGTHIKLVFTTNPLPVQNIGSSLRHSATARLVRSVQGTRYKRAGWPICISARARNVMRRPMP